MKVDRNTHAGDSLLNRSHAFHRGLQLVIGVNPAQLVRPVHFDGLVALGSGDFGFVPGIPGMISADPAIDFDPVAALAPEQIINRHAQRFALDVPHRLFNPGDCAGQDRTAAVEAGTIHLLERILNICGAVPDQLVAEFFHGSGDTVCLALTDRLAPADQTVIRGHLKEQPAGRDFK